MGRLPGNYFFFDLDFRKMSAIRKSRGGGVDAAEIFYARFAF